ncbi:hypothetical protein GGH99_005220, partial [Coemansia sp. RSA 1285]
KIQGKKKERAANAQRELERKAAETLATADDNDNDDEHGAAGSSDTRNILSEQNDSDIIF